MTRKANLALIAEHWDDLLRLAGSLKFGHATASLLVGKLSTSGRQNTLAAALKEYGALRRTIYAAKYLSDPDYRRKISKSTSRANSPNWGRPCGYATPSSNCVPALRGPSHRHPVMPITA